MSYYEESDLKRIPEIARLAPKPTKSYFAFEKEVYHGADILSLKTKELIAIVVGHVTGCPYCIDVHIKNYRDLGGTREEIIAAIMVAASTRSGAILAHATQALKIFDSE